MAESFHAALVETRDLSPTVRHFVFERTDKLPCAFVPGQWHNLFFPQAHGELRRSYSIASPPDGSPRFELTVTRVPKGPASEILHAMPLGTELRCVGPHGVFTRAADDAAAALFVGTGAGIAPLRSMLRAAMNAGSRARMSVLFGVRHEEDILYREELEAAAERGVDLRVTLSQGSPSWPGLRGYVQAHLAEAWAKLGDPNGHVFICGLDKMVLDVKARCRNELAIPRKQVHVESFD